MSIVMQDLEAIRDGNLKLLAVPDHDTRQIQKWGTQRELIFARLQEGNLQLCSDERAAAAPLVKEILELDAEVLARLQQYQATLSRKRTGAVKMQRALAGRSPDDARAVVAVLASLPPS